MPAADLFQLLRPTLTRGLAFSCLGLLAVAGAGAVALYRWLPHSAAADRQPARMGLALVASVCLLSAVLSLWTALQRLVRPGRLQPTQGVGRRLPRRGRVAAEGDALLAPLSGRACVAYCCRAYRHRADAERSFQLVYAAVGGMAFRLEGAGAVTAVHTLPRLLDEADALHGPDVLARARRWVASTPFTPRAGLIGGLSAAVELLGQSAQGELLPGRPYRLAWYDPGAADVDLKGLQFDEIVLALGAEATVVGNWSDAQRALVPSTRADEPTLAAGTAAGLEALHRELGGAELTAGGLREEGAAGAFFAAALVGAFGAAALLLMRVL